MESLAEIFQRIAQRRAHRGPRPAVEEPEERCPLCRGAGFVSRGARVGQPGFGEAYPCRCRQSGLADSRLRYTELPGGLPRATFASFVPVTAEAVYARDAAEMYAAGQSAAAMLVLSGGVGTGKTHLLRAIGWALLDAGVLPKYLYVPDFLDRLRQTFHEGALVPFEQVYGRFEAATVLLVDDLGAERGTPWSQEIMTRIVDHRYRTGAGVVVATNCGQSPESSRQLGERLYDRLFDTHSGRTRLVLTGTQSYRTGQYDNDSV